CRSCRVRRPPCRPPRPAPSPGPAGPSSTPLSSTPSASAPCSPSGLKVHLPVPTVLPPCLPRHAARAVWGWHPDTVSSRRGDRSNAAAGERGPKGCRGGGGGCGAVGEAERTEGGSPDGVGGATRATASDGATVAHANPPPERLGGPSDLPPRPSAARLHVS